jgi:TP901 family phage tail tape measure protein
MDKLMKIAVTLTAVDKMSRVVRDAVGASEGSLKRFAEQRDKAFGKGAAFMAGGAAVMAGLAPTVAAYSELEEASTRLKTAMMGPGGVVSTAFPAMDKLAGQLGDRLPGTTADFYNMFEVMLNNGVKAETILNGVGEAASYLAVQIKMPYDEAAKFASKMREATGVADNQMMAFMDTISRVKNLGVEAGEMQYAFGRSGGALKLMGVQGLEASKSIANVYAQLIRAGMSGETVGTGMSTIFNSLLDPKKMAAMNAQAAQLGVNLEFFKDGKFMGVENMIAQFDKLRGFNAAQRAGVVNALTGGGQDAAMLQTLINNGVAGFNKMNQQMASQATLNQKVGAQLNTLSSKWEATTGTIKNMMAAFGSGLADALKPAVDLLGMLAGWLKTVMANNPALAKFLSMFVAGMGIFITIIGIVKMMQGVWFALNLIMAANPFVLVATVAIAVIALIYANWDKIKAWFTRLWNAVKSIFKNTWEWIKNMFMNYTLYGLVIKHWDKITAWFTGLWAKVKAIFMGFFNFAMNLGSRFFSAGKNIVKSIWEGIKSMANKPVEAIQNIVKKVRDHLPFSPAKTGPLKDIHRIKLIETIAESIKPNSLMEKMQKVTGAVFGFAPRGGGMALSTAGGGGGVTVNMTINFTGGTSPGAANSFVAELRKHKNEISRIFEEAMAQKKRRSF